MHGLHLGHWQLLQPVGRVGEGKGGDRPGIVKTSTWVGPKLSKQRVKNKTPAAYSILPLCWREQPTLTLYLKISPRFFSFWFCGPFTLSWVPVRFNLLAKLADNLAPTINIEKGKILSFFFFTVPTYLVQKFPSRNVFCLSLFNFLFQFA